jgi:pilus assembly protein CpaB
MSRSAAAMSPGRTNKRFIMLAVVLGLIGAVLVYVAFSRGAGGGGGAVADAPVVVAKSEIPARTRITQAMLDTVLIPSDTRSALAFTDPTLVEGKTTRFPISANEQILSTKIIEGSPASTGRSLSYTVPQGRRGFAIEVEEVVSVGGNVIPGDYVDVIIAYDVEFITPGPQGGREKFENFLSQVLFQNIEVLAVSQTIVDIVPGKEPAPNGQRERNSEGKPQKDAATVTLALTVEEAQKMLIAVGNGEVRLALRSFGDADQRPLDPLTIFDLFPRNLQNPFTR